MTLFPSPRAVSDRKCRFDFSRRRWLILPPGAGFELKEAALRTASALSERFFSPVEVTAGEPGAGECLLAMVREPGIPPEGYRLETAPEGGLLFAASDAGFYYGLLTFRQLLAEPSRVPGVLIADAPDFPRRGYMLDVSRCKVPTMESLKSLIDSLSLLRYNELQLYTEHSFAFAGDERVWFDSSPLTPAEIMELDRCCRDRFIELVPNLNSFGHLGRWLGMEEYRHLAESPEPWYFEAWDAWYQATLTPGKEALAFIDRLYAEFLPNFTSGILNVGCDETMELGQGRSRELCTQRGLHRVYLDYLAELVKLAGKYGRRVQFWGDIILHEPELIPELPPGVTALAWGYEANHPFEAECAQFREAGVPFYVCPGTSAWNSVTGRTANMLGNIASAARSGHEAGAAGLLLTDWGDGGHHQYRPLSWPGIAAAAGWSWNASADVETAVPYAVDFAFNPGGSGGSLGAYLLDYGRIVDAFAHPGVNCNGFWAILNAPERRGNRELLELSTRKEIAAAQRKLAAWRRKIETRPPRAPRLVLDELANSSALAHLALEAMAGRKGKSFDRSAWNDGLRHVIGRHRDLWLARNRAGGLRESMGVLERFFLK
ncbi:MAG: family 20 glycosylhydrolase [Lentisphaeria bacterium]|nr:family 20 glycosylhydrolase [Lentisphaeria bacterium]